TRWRMCATRVCTGIFRTSGSSSTRSSGWSGSRGRAADSRSFSNDRLPRCAAADCAAGSSRDGLRPGLADAGALAGGAPGGPPGLVARAARGGERAPVAEVPDGPDDDVGGFVHARGARGAEGDRLRGDRRVLRGGVAVWAHLTGGDRAGGGEWF